MDLNYSNANDVCVRHGVALPLGPRVGKDVVDAKTDYFLCALRMMRSVPAYAREGSLKAWSLTNTDNKQCNAFSMKRGTPVQDSFQSVLPCGQDRNFKFALCEKGMIVGTMK